MPSVRSETNPPRPPTAGCPTAGLTAAEVSDPPGFPWVHEFVLPREAASVGRSRRVLTDLVAGWEACGDPGARPVLETGRLVLSELVTNAVMHPSGGTTGQVRVCLSYGIPGLLIEVSDLDATAEVARPEARPADDLETCGRGLWLVSELSAQWGRRVAADGSGKTVWARIAPAPHDAGAS